MEILMTRLDPKLRRLSRYALMAIAGLGLFSPDSGSAADSMEYGVKAAFLSKFGSYVEWPEGAFISPTSPLHLCVISSDDQFVATLEKVAGADRINSRAVVVRRLKAIERDSGCHILYIGGAEAQKDPRIFDTLRGTSVLTVTDTQGAGIIDFVIANNRVRFDIDDEAAAQNGLVISSKLLSLALNVKRRASQGSL